MPFDLRKKLNNAIYDTQTYIADKLGVGEILKYADSRPADFGMRDTKDGGTDDAARHILLAAELQRTHPKLAPWLLYGHEAVNYLQDMGDPYGDVKQDLYNNSLGKEIGRTSTSRKEIEQRMLATLPRAKIQGSSMQNPLDVMHNGLQMLHLDQATDPNSGFDVQAHQQRLLTTGPFAEATKRQSVWDQSSDAAHVIRKSTSGLTFAEDPANQLRPSEFTEEPILHQDDGLKTIQEKLAKNQNDAWMDAQGASRGSWGGNVGSWGGSSAQPVEE